MKSKGRPVRAFPFCISKTTRPVSGFQDTKGGGQILPAARSLCRLYALPGIEVDHRVRLHLNGQIGAVLSLVDGQISAPVGVSVWVRKNSKKVIGRKSTEKVLISQEIRTFWLRRQDSNLRPPGYEPDELPAALLRDIQFCAVPGAAPRMEVTTWVMSPTSYQLLYPAIWNCGNTGAGDRTRTGTVSLPGDFKSPVSTNSTTPADIGNR